MPLNLPPVEVTVDRSANPVLRVKVRLHWLPRAVLDVPLLMLSEPRRWKRGQKRTARDRRRARMGAVTGFACNPDTGGWPP